MLAINQILSKAGITISTGTLIQKLKSDISLNVVEEYSQKKETYFNKTNDYSSNVYFDAQSTETAFRRVSIFSPLNDQEIKKLSDGVIKKTFATDETIIKQGEFGETMFLINKGVVEITIQGADNNENIVGVLTVGDIFGEMSCLTGENRNATVKVIRPAVVYEVSKTLMSEIFENNPSIIDQLSILLENRTKENDLFIDSIRAGKLGYSELKLEKLPEKIRSFFK
jgi:CRP-like cAMP-binding protein